MTTPRRDWMKAIDSGQAGVTDIIRAARSCMAAADDCPPELCGHSVNRMTPLEFAEWIEDELSAGKRAPVRLDQRETRKAGQVHRRLMEMVATG